MRSIFPGKEDGDVFPIAATSKGATRKIWTHRLKIFHENTDVKETLQFVVIILKKIFN